MTTARLILAASILALVQNAHAGTYTWQTAGTTNNWSAAGGDTNWFIDAGSTLSTWADGNDAVFAAAAGEIVTLTGTVAPTSTTINNNGSWTITNAAGFVLGGSGTLVKNGAGTLTLNGATSNTYSGGTTINAGVLNAGTTSTNNFLGTGAVLVNSGASLILNASRATNYGDFTLNGVGASGMSGALVLGAGASFSSITVTSLTLGANATIGTGAGWGGGNTISGGNLSIGANTLTFNPLTPTGYESTESLQINNNIIGTGNIVQNGPGITRLAGTNTYTGNTTVFAGALVATKAAALSGYNTAGKVVLNGGTLGVQVGGTNWLTTQVDTLLDTFTRVRGDFGIDTSNANTTDWANLNTKLGTLGLVKLGSNTLTLTQTNTNTRNSSTTVNQGTLALDYATVGDTSKLSDTGALIVNNGTIQMTGATGSHVEALGSFIVNGFANITRSGANTAVLALGNYKNNGVLNVSANGLATTTVANNTAGYLSGVLFGGNQYALNDGSGNIVAATGLTYADVTHQNSGAKTISSASGSIVRIIEGTGGSPANITMTAGGTTDIGSLFQTAGGNTTTVSIGAGNTLRLDANGLILTTTGASPMVITAGTLTAGGANNTAGTLDIRSASQAIDGSNSAFGTTISSLIADNGSGVVAVQTGGGNVALSNSANTYTGPTTINSGTLSVSTLANGGSNSAIGKSSNAAANLVFGSPTATLRYTGSNVTTDRGFTMSGGVGGGATIESSGAGALTFNNTVAIAYGTVNETRTLTLGGTSTAANTFAKTITDNGSGATSFVKAGLGAWTLSGTSTYSGNTTVTAGTLTVTGSLSGTKVAVNGGTFAGSGSVNTSNQAFTVASGAKLDPTSAAFAVNTGTANLDISGAAGDTNTGALVFNLDSIANSDKITLTLTGSGALAIGSGVLDFADFAFTTTGGFGNGTYTLIDTNAAINGTLGSNLTGTINGMSATLALSADNTDLILNVVPEPTAAVSLLGGLGLLAGARRRRR